MQIRKKIVWFLFALLLGQTLLLPHTMTTPVQAEASKDFKVVAYYPSWRGASYQNTIQYDLVTHLVYAFAIPTESGGLLPLENPEAAKSLIRNAHANGVKVLLAVGGWSHGDSLLEPVFAAATSTAAKRGRLVRELVELCDTYGFDGIDVDWEYPRSGTTAGQYEKLITALADQLHPRGKLLTAAVIGGTTTSGGSYSLPKAISDTVLETVDWIHVMAYDGDNGGGHSTYAYAKACGNYWKNTRGLPAEKVVLGMPFYARPGSLPYRAIIQAVPGAEHRDSVMYQGRQIWYNGLDTISEKTVFARDNLGGVMVWEITQDTTDKRKSLLSAIGAVLEESSWFHDVPAGAWYAESAEVARKLGLMRGTSQRIFSPGGTVTHAQAVSIASRIHTLHHTGKDPLKQEGTPWYGEYEAYALKNGILEAPLTAKQAVQPITRAEFAQMLAAALPAEALKAVNQVRRIPDVSLSDTYGPAVFRLYRAGVFAGKNSSGVFFPHATLNRAEAAVLIARMMEPGRRLRFPLP